VSRDLRLNFRPLLTPLKKGRDLRPLLTPLKRGEILTALEALFSVCDSSPHEGRMGRVFFFRDGFEIRSRCALIFSESLVQRY